LVLKTFGIPEVAYSATSPELSDTGEYPYFYRTCASDAFQAKAMASYLYEELGYTKVCTIVGSDSYSKSGMEAFNAEAESLGLVIDKAVEHYFNPTATQAKAAVDDLAASKCRVIFAKTQADPFGKIARAAEPAGIMGATTDWFWAFDADIGGNSVNAKVTAEAADTLDDGTVVPAIDYDVALEGSVGCIPLQPSGTDYDTWVVRYSAQANTAGTCGTDMPTGVSGCTCNSETDSYGNKLWQWDHDLDGDATTPEHCVGFDFTVTSDITDYAYYAYDAVYALANASKNLIAAGTPIAKASLATELYSVSFSGLTGTVEFEATGDREVGTGYTILNANGAGYSEMGTWDSTNKFAYATGKDLTDMVWPTAGGTQPTGIVYDIVELKIGVLNPTFKVAPDFFYDEGGLNCFSGGFLMAINEINDKTDGIHDDLLPNTKIVFEYVDSKRSSSYALAGAYYLGNEAFDGQGADVVLGASSSGPTASAQLALKNFGIPQMSYSATSPSLSDAGEYPTFFRSVGSDAFQAKAIANILKNELGYNNVCTIKALDDYSAAGMSAFNEAAQELDIFIAGSSEVFENPTPDGVQAAIKIIKDAQCNVVFAMAQATAGGQMAREAVRQGILGGNSNYMWVFADAVTGFMPDVKASAQVATALEDGTVVPAIDVDVDFKGSLGLNPLKPANPEYDAWLLRYAALPSTEGTCGNQGETGTAGCSCNQQADSFGNLLFQRDHDEDPSTPDRCVGFDYSDINTVNAYLYYKYDAAYALARAAHKMVEDGSTSFDGPTFMSTLKELSFTGISGTIEFESNGDRTVGVGFSVYNHDGEGNFGTIGGWEQSTGLVFATGNTVDSFIYANEANTPPPNIVLPLCGADHITPVVGKCNSDSMRPVTYVLETAEDSFGEQSPTCEGGLWDTVPVGQEVDCEYSPASSGAASLAFLLGIVGGIICLASCLWIILNISEQVIKMAQPAFCLAFALSAAVGCFSNILFVGENTDTMCTLRPIVFNLAFDMMFGSLFLKTYRVYKIFGNKALTKQKTTPFDILQTYLVVLMIDIALMIIWKVGSGMKAETIVEDELMPYGTYETVKCNVVESMEFATTFYKVMLVGGGVYLAWATRAFPDKFSESKYISASIYQVFLLGVVGLLVKSSAPDSLLLVQAVCVPIACASTCLMIFVPKFLMIRNPSVTDSAMVQTSYKSSMSDDDEVGTLTDQVAELEAKLAKINAAK
jgi:ABC-type branched-subunit amino acid transport system substrate-binding protein